jgi:hypothetical protein
MSYTLMQQGGSPFSGMNLCRRSFLVDEIAAVTMLMILSIINIANLCLLEVIAADMGLVVFVVLDLLSVGMTVEFHVDLEAVVKVAHTCHPVHWNRQGNEMSTPRYNG